MWGPGGSTRFTQRVDGRNQRIRLPWNRVAGPAAGRVPAGAPGRLRGMGLPLTLGLVLGLIAFALFAGGEVLVGGFFVGAAAILVLLRLLGI